MRVLLSTLWKNDDPGKAPSRAKAYIMREFDVIENTLFSARGGVNDYEYGIYHRSSHTRT